MEEGCGGVGVLTRLGRGQKRRRAGLCAGLGMQGPQKPRADSRVCLAEVSPATRDTSLRELTRSDSRVFYSVIALRRSRLPRETRPWPRADLHRARITRKFVCGGGGGGGGGGGMA